jgi:hypothetical protein
MKSEKLLATRFIRRYDVRAEQQDDGSYICIREPLTGDHLRSHLRGDLTLGAYVLNENGHASYTVFDADDEVEYHRLFSMANRLALEEIPSYMEESRRGGHLWFFHERAISGEAAKRFGEGLSIRFGLETEVFPKSVTGNVGSLVRLPFGIHRKSGQRYPFVNIEDGLLIAPTVRQQLIKLQTAERVKLGDIRRHMEIAPLRERYPETEDNTDVFAYVSQFVELKPTKSGGVGHCPFHDDEHMSFSVNRRGNYWNYFAGCGGGRVEQFRAKWDLIEGGQK